MSPTVHPIDFSSTPLSSSYTGFFATVIDDLLTPAECDALLEIAVKDTGDEAWRPAGLMAHADKETVHADFRNSDRILLMDHSASEMLYNRLRPLVPEIHEIKPDGPWALVTGKAGRGRQNPTWRLARVNPRLSFLRYGPGQYFKPHCDGLNTLEEQKSFVTLHIYLNGSATGGATRFWTPDKKHYLDVEPKVGRCLVFQQRMLVHSGEEVTGGFKYTLRSDFMFEQV
ncbi:hypothetical protein FB45DRAFT_895924 [Roridomyces roridus]|uniref:Fe2OG dioxygenase domain-containing protein n=1 Tax=Roridomyces roridus TaxID=1738132 RepID=A0AAD7CAB3_9AGAR|nr:hypothetical protein FB45DRAFT_895907 [Roridomyces roridus]KAJ7643742.1 hypothetical protein FB45DRAFT_895924 [Roridomyces roridus]